MVLTCKKHNLPEDIICVGQFCTKRIACQLCVNKHDHKFFLDTKNTQKTLLQTQSDVNTKVFTLQKYTIFNIETLKLQEYRQKILQSLSEEQFYINSKIDEQLLNFNCWVEKSRSTLKTIVNNARKTILKFWQQYHSEAQHHKDNAKQFQKIKGILQQGNWTTHEHVEKAVNFLYSEQLLFRFNRALDNLKKFIKHHKTHNQKILDWFQDRRNRFKQYPLCPHPVFQGWLKQYQNQYQIPQYIFQKTKETRDDGKSFLEYVGEEQKAVIIYPKTSYQPFQTIYKLIRYDNQLFITSGGRSINTWTRISLQPQKVYSLDYPTYGICTFNEKGKQEPQQLLFGQSNGQLGVIDMKKQKVRLMPAHSAAIRDIIQYDSYHFLTASQDWALKLWAFNKPDQKYFASQRLHLKGHSGKVHCLTKFGHNILAAGSDGTIKLWDIMRQSYDQVFAQEKQIYALAEIRPELFASGGQINQLRIWDYRKVKAPIFKFRVQFCCGAILKYDSNTIIFSDKNRVKIVDIRNGKEPILRYENNTIFSHQINSIDYLSDVQIGMGGNDNFISIWKY